MLCTCGLAVYAAGLVAQAPPDGPPVKPNAGAITLAVEALGSADLQTLRYLGAGDIYVGGPDADPTATRPPVAVSSYEVSIDYPASAMQVEVVRATNSSPASGEPAAVDQRWIQAVNGTLAWDVAFAPGNATSGVQRVATRAKSGRGSGPTPQPPQSNPAASSERRQGIWITPHGFLKAALANQPTLRPAGSGTEVSFFSGSSRYVGFINSKNQVERVRTWVADPVLGDRLIDTTYTEYQLFGKTRFPTHITQKHRGQLALDLVVSAVQPNAPVRLAVPEGLR